MPRKILEQDEYKIFFKRYEKKTYLGGIVIKLIKRREMKFSVRKNGIEK
jgi:uncharacterized protein YebE (UPF0316 family)